MSDYTKLTDFRVKDYLASGDPDKLVTGAELDAEFEAIEAAIASKTEDIETVVTVDLPAGSNTFSAGFGSEVSTLTDGATVAIDADLSNVFYWNPTGASRTLSFPTNLKEGQEIIVVIRNGVTGGGLTITYGSGWQKATGADVQPTQTEDAIDVIRARCVTNTAVLYIVSMTKNYVNV